jgi:2-keto-4-pentenoate hydratase/2-oxohepta-3-ene-1,7-dioic acid hydratase in catechol pathway
VGGARKPPEFLQPGDIVRQEVDGPGVMEYEVVDDVV